MAVLDLHLGSDALRMQTEVVVTLPDAPPPASGYPVLYLLHGSGDDATAWTRWTGIERYAERFGLAVVMPSAAHSFYCDEVFGHRWWTWIAEELPRRLGGILALDPARESTFAAGLSMGGYGAMKLGLRHPDRFAAVASLSGSLGWATRRPPAADRDPELATLRTTIWGDRDPAGTDDDLAHLLETTPRDELPALYVACGEQDFLLRENTEFLALADRLGVPVTRVLRPGDHEWGFWDAEIQAVLDWLPLPAR